MAKTFKPKFEITKCSRCGKSLTVIHSSNPVVAKLQKKSEPVCKDCTTPEELYQINDSIGRAFAGVGNGNLKSHRTIWRTNETQKT